MANATFLTNHILKAKTTEEPATPPEIQEPVLPASESLVAQFQARTIYAIGEASDERLTSSYWLNVPAPQATSGEDDGNDSELVRRKLIFAVFLLFISLKCNFLVSWALF